MTTTTTPLLPTRVDADRLLSNLERLRAIGATPEGGVTRRAFSREDVKGQEFVAGLMREAGLDVRVDAAANLVGTRQGRGGTGAPLVLGSHLDTVPGGGAYDGAYGVLAAVEVAHTLHESGTVLDRPLCVMAFSNEEGTTGTPAMFGSRAVAGCLEPGELDLVVTGQDRALAQVLDAAGGDSRCVDDVRRAPGSVAAYLELHIEQGPVLIGSGTDIGIVEGISGRLTAEVTVQGQANHAGTTPMADRHDALLAAARLTVAVPSLTGPGGVVRVATVGDCQVSPGAWNVVPGRARVIVDLRDMSEDNLRAGLDRLRAMGQEAGSATGTTVDVTEVQRVSPTPCDPGRRATVRRVADALGLSSVTLPSGAGHDAQWMARVAPTGMIFVPSEDGASHVPYEHTAPADLVRGAGVLLGCTLLEGMTT
ncbi:Zn-dependent hydrolase [Streptomyces sp. NBC_00859]|uniref:Zn-dependent hydrolase n=1 Tax=Streptomyces sp. NBC_00859 TaxID=2903682 RepID=UPI003870D235|nr:Zn-dependent hydrolase [Streptomyces sp. NBC_00859]